MDSERPDPVRRVRRWRPWVAALFIILACAALWAGIVLLLHFAG